MDGAEQTDSGWRGSPELWLDAAYETLIEQGIDAVKIQPLGTRLRLSRTSFYWFFKDRAALLAALADRWESRTTKPLVAACGAYAATEAEAILNVIGCFLSDRTFDSRFEFAVRGWALRDRAILDRLHAADNLRLSALRALLERWYHDPMDADVRARTIYMVQIGYISMQTRENLETRLERVPSYVETYCGQRPSDAEMARIRARLQALT
ncbi:TetR/AcrR family transcriptional regulator [Rhodovulum strictum]|uniref:TetR family transcriptional regulator n=1 Tax=Rhodovulum strictum TaxID=58314 RepID=A0A844BG35_9RHOB|nr:TetR/AcrR family transcriptional regulator [Rhodovulum strictum]MRH21498.1 TetR family transcriptional regulator [Rhodovulum strictum]